MTDRECGGRLARDWRALLFSSAAALAGVAGPAFAQSAGAAAASAEQTPPNTAETEPRVDSNEVEAIVVTAQRREENLQDVPVSVTALSGETLKNANITDVVRLEQVTPGLRIGRSGSDARPTIRGIFTEAIQANSDPRIAFYIDDIYQSRTAQGLTAFVDLERVEVQRGPQGTLYGRNSFGGNIALFTAEPRDEFSAGVDVLYGRFNRVRTEGFVNMPLAEGVALRVAGLYERQDGYIENTSTGSDLGDEDTRFVRASLRLAPASVPQFEAVFRASHLYQGGAGASAFFYKVDGTQVDPALIRPPGGTLDIGGSNLVLPNGFNGSTFSSGMLVPFNPRFRDGIPDINGADIGVPVETDPYKINFDFNAIRRTRQTNLSATLNYDAGSVRLRSITGFTNFYANRSSDADLSPFPVGADYNTTDVRTFSQEVQLLSDFEDSPLQFIVGAFYYDDVVEEAFLSKQNKAFPAPGQLLYGPGLTFVPLPGSLLSPLRNDFYAPLKVTTESYAVFGQASFDVTDALTLTAGYRYTEDRKTYRAGTTQGGLTGVSFDYGQLQDYDFECGATNPASSVASGDGSTASVVSLCDEETFGFSTYRLVADYEVTTNNLLYASVSTGRHSGGFNNTRDPVTGDLIPFQTEEVTAYEVGTKNLLLDRTLQINVAAYYNDLKDLHVQNSIPASNGLSVVSLITNAGESRAYGVELESIFKPTDRLTLSANYAYLKAEDIDNIVGTFSGGFCGPAGPVGGPCPNPAIINTPQGAPFPNAVSDPGRFIPVLLANGQQAVAFGAPVFSYVLAGRGSNGVEYRSPIPISPKHTLQVGAAYEFDLGGRGTLTPNAQFYYNSGYILTAFTPDFGVQEAYTRTDLRLNFLSEDERVSAQLYVENIEDEAVINRVGYGGGRSLSTNYAPPRTYGVKVGFRY